MGFDNTDGLYQDMRMHMRYTVCMSMKPVQIDIKDICTSLFPKKPKDYVHALLVLVRRNYNNGKRKRNCVTSDCTWDRLSAHLKVG